jgi:hypothetical protein
MADDHIIDCRYQR